MDTKRFIELAHLGQAVIEVEVSLKNKRAAAAQAAETLVAKVFANNGASKESCAVLTELFRRMDSAGMFGGDEAQKERKRTLRISIQRAWKRVFGEDFPSRKLEGKNYRFRIVEVISNPEMTIEEEISALLLGAGMGRIVSDVVRAISTEERRLAKEGREDRKAAERERLAALAPRRNQEIERLKALELADEVVSSCLLAWDAEHQYVPVSK